MAIGRAIADAEQRSVYDRPIWDDTPPAKGATDDDGSWSPHILKDMTHPLFTEHKQRFERWQDTQQEDW